MPLGARAKLIKFRNDLARAGQDVGVDARHGGFVAVFVKGAIVARLTRFSAFMALAEEAELGFIVAAILFVIPASCAVLAGDLALIGFTDFAVFAADVVTSDIVTAIVDT